MQTLRNVPVARKLYIAFAGVSLLFGAALAATLILGSSAQNAWRHAQTWTHAVDGIDLQIEGTRQQLAAQALYVATFEPKYKAEWLAGVDKGNGGSAIVTAIGDLSSRRSRRPRTRPTTTTTTPSTSCSSPWSLRATTRRPSRH
jgi:hypothetical protein